jgi:hypothetical protein
MGKIRKTIALFLTLIIALSCMTIWVVKSAYSQSILKPPMPEFAINFSQTLYTVTAPDPVSGENITQQFQNNTIQVKIDNRPFSSSLNEDKYHLFYNISTKIHSESNWSELYPPERYYNDATNFNSTALNLARTPTASTSEYTTISFHDYYPSYPPNTEIGFSPPFHFPPGTQLDLEVRAIIGVDSQVYIADHPTAPRFGGDYEPAIVVDVASDWSNTQTITIAERSTSTSPTPNPTPTPTIPEFPILVILPLFLSLISSALILGHRKNHKTR